MWCHWSPQMQWLCYALSASLCWAVMYLMVVMANRLFSTPHVINLIVWDLYCDSLVVRGVFSCNSLIYIYVDLWELYLYEKLYDWYGLKPFYISIILYFCHNIVLGNPLKSLDFLSILVDFTLYIVKSVDFSVKSSIL